MTRQPAPSRPFSADPSIAREQRIAEAATIVRQALDAEGASRPVVAAHLGISDGELKRTTSPTSGRMISLADVMGLPPLVLRRVVDAVIEPMALSVVELPEPASGADELRALATAQRETAEAIAHGLDAVADGHFTRAEGARVEQECDEAIAALLAIRERARLAQREGVIGLRAVGGAR